MERVLKVGKHLINIDSIAYVKDGNNMHTNEVQLYVHFIGGEMITLEGSTSDQFLNWIGSVKLFESES